MRLEVADQHFLICAQVLPLYTMPPKVIQFAKGMPKRPGQRKLPSFMPIPAAQSISSWSSTCLLIPLAVWGRKSIPLTPSLGPVTPDCSVSMCWPAPLWSLSCPTG